MVDFDGNPIKISRQGVFTPIDAVLEYKDGLIIMPFKIDTSELDDECRYYLGRHAFFMGQEPPVVERIRQFVAVIKEVLSN